MPSFFAPVYRVSLTTVAVVYKQFVRSVVTQLQGGTTPRQHKSPQIAVCLSYIKEHEPPRANGSFQQQYACVHVSAKVTLHNVALQ
jgi:hypothetical protein